MPHLILIRHGQTVANVEARWIGRGHTELTELGRAQIAATAQRLAAEVHDGAALYSSPLGRTMETAGTIGHALGLEPVPLDDLREVDFGDMEGVLHDELKVQHPEVYARWRNMEDSEFAWPGGDRRADFFRRVAGACQRILSRHDRGTVLVVAHAGTLRACLAHLLPEQMGQWWTYKLDNCGLTRLEIEGPASRLLVLNDTAHLPSSG